MIRQEMVTAKQVLMQLPLQKRLQAIENIRRERTGGLKRFNTEKLLDIESSDNLRIFLEGAFRWNKTRQGHNYWAEIVFNL